ncbi:unnamed protein product, partial [Coccothraustes coccothraustes]
GFLQADPKQGPAMALSDKGGQPGCSLCSGSSKMRRRWLPWPFALWQGPAGTAQAPGYEGSGCSRTLFRQPLAAVCTEDGPLPQP